MFHIQTIPLLNRLWFRKKIRFEKGAKCWKTKALIQYCIIGIYKANMNKTGSASCSFKAKNIEASSRNAMGAKQKISSLIWQATASNCKDSQPSRRETRSNVCQ